MAQNFGLKSILIVIRSDPQTSDDLEIEFNRLSLLPGPVDLYFGPANRQNSFFFDENGDSRSIILLKSHFDRFYR